MAQYQDGDRRFGMVRRNGVWVPDDQQSGAPQAPAPSPAAPQPWISAPREPPPQTAPQATLDQYQAQAGAYSPAKAAADTQRAQAEAEYARQREAASVEQSRTSAASNRTQIQNTAFDNERNLAKEFSARPEVQTFTTIAPMYASALRAAKVDTRSADTDLVNAYAKIVDPPSVVRESEAKQAGDTGGPSEQLKGYMNSMAGGGRLTPEQRHQIITQVRNRASAAADIYRQTREQYTNLAQQHGIDPGRIVLGNPAQPFQQLEADYFGHPIKNGNNFVQPHGQQAAQGGAQPGGGPVQPLDPEGVGDIGFYNRDALSAPPKAQEAQKDIQAAILSGNLRTPEAISGYAKQKWGFDIPPDQAKAAAEAVLKGGSISVATPQYAKPDISADRGGKPLQGIDAILRGATDVATRGLSDEAAAGLDTLGGGNFSSNLARERAIDHYDMKNQTGLRLGGQVAGGFMMPFAGAPKTVAGLAKMGAIEGGLYGFGSGQGSLLDRGLNAAGGTVTGGAAGAGLGAGGNVIARGVRGLFGRKAGGTIPPLVDPVTGSLNQPLEDATMAQRMAAGKQVGVNLPMDAAGGRTAAFMGKGLDIMPGSAGVMEDARRGVHGEVETAVSNLAGRYGGGRTLDDAGQALQQGANNWLGRFDNVTAKAYDAIPIKGPEPAAIGNTKAALERLTTIFQSNPELAAAFQNNKLNTYLGALTEKVRNVDTGLVGSTGSPITRQVKEGGGLSWQDLKDMRSRIGYEIGEQRFSDSPTKDELRSLYASMSEDMRATAQAKGPGALHRFERANSLYAQGQDRIDSALVRILGDNSKNNPEAAAAAIQTIAKSGRGSANIQQLNAIRNSMRKGGEWNDVASTMIRLGGQPANSQGREFNPQTFISWYADMSEPARNLLFADGGRQELRKALDGFVGVTQRLQNANALRNTSQTAPGLTAAGTVGTLGAAIFNPILGAKVAAVGAANYGMAKLWTSPKFVNWATGYTRSLQSGNPRAIQGQIGALRRVAATNPLIRDSVEDLMKSLMGGNQP